jgi:hypothetical protein
MTTLLHALDQVIPLRLFNLNVSGSCPYCRPNKRASQGGFFAFGSTP